MLGILNTCLVNNGVVRFFDTWGRVITMATLNINYDFKMSQPFTEFTFTWLSNLKSAEGRKAVSYNLKYLFCHQCSCSLDSHVQLHHSTPL